MIKIYVKDYEVELTGHAEREGEQNLVCAAASLTVQAAARVMDNLKHLCEDLNVQIEDGYADIKFTPKEGWEDVTGLAFHSALTGLYLLAENYPDKVVGVDDKQKV